MRVPASLDGARVSMQIDVGFGDLVDPPPSELTFPVLLPLEAPVLRAYPPEAVIAEKFHAMVVLGIANSRMKDFSDVWTLAQTHRFNSEVLGGSIRGTFNLLICTCGSWQVLQRTHFGELRRETQRLPRGRCSNENLQGAHRVDRSSACGG